MAGDYCVLKFLGRNVDGKDLMRFQSENRPFSNFSGVEWTEPK